MKIENVRGWPEFGGIRLSPIHEKCEGCAKTIVSDEFDSSYCRIYANPPALWRRGCTMATHVTWGDNDTGGRKRVGQQKGSRKKKAKRAGR